MGGFTKLSSDIITSSVWSEDDKTRIMWITMLALAEATGFVPAAIPGLANAARMSIPEAEKALAKLEAPDPYSRSTVNGGRRLTKVEGGWQIVNYAYYREKGRSRDRTEYYRQYRKNRKRTCAQPPATGGNRKTPIAEAIKKELSLRKVPKKGEHDPDPFDAALERKRAEITTGTIAGQHECGGDGPGEYGDRSDRDPAGSGNPA